MGSRTRWPIPTPSPAELRQARGIVRWHVFREGRMVPPHLADYDDLQQVVMMAVLRKWPKRTEPLAVWLHLTARSALIDEVRSLLGRRRSATRAKDGTLRGDALRHWLAVGGAVSLSDAVLDGGDAPTVLDNVALATWDEPYEDIEERERRRVAVQKAMAMLPLRLASVAQLVFLEEMSNRDVAEMMGISESRVCQLLAEARRMLVLDLRARIAA